MKLITKEVEAKLAKHPLYSEQENPNPEILVKFFQPWGGWTWYATEGSFVCPDHATFDCIECPKPWTEFMFFGLVDGHEKELGYFTLSELQSLRGPGGLTIERDMYFEGKHLQDVQN
jgi:hypothetical protein